MVHGYVTEVHDESVNALAPGKDLESMTGAMLQEASICLDHLILGIEMDIFTWIRQTVTMCSTRAIYGSENPFNRDPALVRMFWYVHFD